MGSTMGVPFEQQDDDAEDALTFPDRLLLSAKGLPERPLVIVAIMVAMTLVLASVLYAIIGQSPYYPDDELPETVFHIDDMRPFENTVSYDLYVNEGEELANPYDLYHTLELPDEEGEIVICLIDRVTVTVTWMDEPDASRAMITLENQPDTVRSTVSTYEGLFTAMDEVSNVHGEMGVMELSWRGEGDYVEDSWRRVSEHEWEGVQGEDYVTVKGANVHWSDFLTGELLLVQAGDQTHDVLPLGQSDDGNLLSFQVTLGGRYMSLPPGTYSDQSDR
jgi:hypothetical protein